MTANATDGLYPQSIVRGALYILAAAAVFSGVGACVKALTAELPVAMVVFFRSAFGLVVLVPWLLRRRDFRFHTARPGAHLVRALFGVCAMYLFFFALSRLPLAVAVMLNFAAPLFIPLVAAAWLREPMSARVYGCLGVGFAGVLLVMRPGGVGWEPAALAGIVSALFASVALVGVRNLSTTEPASRIVFYFGLFASLVALPAAGMTWVAPTPAQWGMGVVIGVGATAGQWLITRGYASAPAGRVGYYQYSSVIYATLLGWLIWGEVPDGWAWTGCGFILVAGVAASGYRWAGLGTAVLGVLGGVGRRKESTRNPSNHEHPPVE